MKIDALDGYGEVRGRVSVADLEWVLAVGVAEDWRKAMSNIYDFDFAPLTMADVGKIKQISAISREHEIKADDDWVPWDDPEYMMPLLDLVDKCSVVGLRNIPPDDIAAVIEQFSAALAQRNKGDGVWGEALGEVEGNNNP